MDLQPVTSLDDPRVAPFRDLKDADLRRADGLFIAEGPHIVQRLLESNYRTVSILLTRRHLDRLAPHVPPGLPAYLVDDDLICRIVGFKFHLGVLACGQRRIPPALADILSEPPAPLTLLICPDLHNTENLGLILRLAAAFGVDAMLLGPGCCDPFFRQSIRVSMGAVFRLPIVLSRDLAADLRELRKRWGVELAAAVTDLDAQPLAHAARPARLGLLLGSEDQGLDPAVVALCDRRVTIPMQLGVDSLNVAVAAAVFLYHFQQVSLPARSDPV